MSPSSLSGPHQEQFGISTNLLRKTTIILIATIALAFVFHLIFMYIFYWQRFHSDTAVAYVVAEQILNEGNLFPEHFKFGNDIFFLRPQFAIALLMKFGMTGYKAYAFATSLMFATAFGMIASSLMLLRSKTSTALAATILLYIPLGFNEFDYILGQQSHLMQSSLSLVAAILFYCTCHLHARRATTLALFCIVALLAIDSIMRAVLTTAAIIGVGLVLLTWSKHTVKSVVVCALALATGFILRSVILLHVQLVGVAHMTLDWRRGAIFQKLAELWIDIKTVAFSTRLLTFEDFGSAAFTIAHLIIIAAFVAITLWLVCKSFTLLQKRFAVPEFDNNSAGRQTVFIGAVGMVISLIGIGVAVLGNLGPVTRHFLPGLFMIKFALAWTVADACFNKQAIIHRAFGLCLAVSLVLASPVTLPAISKFYRQGEYTQRASLHEIISKLREIDVIREGQGHLYGEYWDAYRFAVLSRTTLSSAPVAVWQGKMVGSDWLSIPQRFCAVENQPVAYLVRNNNPKLRDVIDKAASRIRLSPNMDVFVEGGGTTLEDATKGKPMPCFTGSGPCPSEPLGKHSASLCAQIAT